jgi:hypothetical protein
MLTTYYQLKKLYKKLYIQLYTKNSKTLKIILIIRIIVKYFCNTSVVDEDQFTFVKRKT